MTSLFVDPRQHKSNDDIFLKLVIKTKGKI